MATKTTDPLAEANRAHRAQAKKLREANKLAGRTTGTAQAEYSARESEERRDIAIGKVKDPDRRELCRTDLELFALTYFPARFHLPFAKFHLDTIRHLSTCMNNGGLFTCALPRGSGKDALGEVAVLHAILYGKRKFVMFIGATEDAAKQSLKKIKSELEGNDLLKEDFPEACDPIRALERINNRCRGQTHNSLPTRMEFTADALVLSTTIIDGKPSLCNGATIKVAGLTGNIRGLAVQGPDGQHIRPDMVIVNDAQTRESSRSPVQTAYREAMIQDDVLMLAGPTTTVAAVMLCTVIYRNDLSDRFLNKDKHPEWQSVRAKMLDTFPKDIEMWDEYSDIYRNGMREGDNGNAGNEFYAANREKMDAGGAVSWPARKKAGELSGLQSAMNLYYTNRRGFFAEAQNDPEAAEVASGGKELTPDLIASKMNGVERYIVPSECTRLTAFIDVGGGVHWYSVMGFSEQFGGTVIDYGAWPRQNRQIFEASDARPSLKDQYPQNTTDAQRVFAGLHDLTSELMGRTYFRQSGGADMQIELCLIDSGWETKAVYDFIRQSPFSTRIRPSKGYARSTTSRGISEWKPRPGERKGYFWRLTMGEHGRVQCVQFDPDAWKSFVHAGIVTPLGGKTGITLFGKSAQVHEQIANHLSAEYSEPATLRGTTFDKWQIRPDRPDNHLLDTVVGCHVAASLMGLHWQASGVPVIAPAKPGKEKWSEMQARKRAG